MPGQTMEQQKAVEALSEVRRLLAEWLRTSEDSREPVAKILELLERVDAYIRTDNSSVLAAKGKKSGRGNTYSIDKVRNQEVLTEHRAGGSSPFRCPRHFYDATAKALAQADAPLSFEELFKAVEKLAPDPAEFQVRAAVRFLASVEPPLIMRDRNRYRPAHRGKFESQAKNAWSALAKEPK
jgi:hypothetical protein